MAVYRKVNGRDQLVSMRNLTLAELKALKDAGGLPPAQATPAAPQGGPGTELEMLIAALGFPHEGCGTCGSLAGQMDRGGAAWCREHREEILAHLREQAAGLGWWDTVKAGVAAVREGLPLTVEGLLDEAIRRAEEKGCSNNAGVPPRYT